MRVRVYFLRTALRSLKNQLEQYCFDILFCLFKNNDVALNFPGYYTFFCFNKILMSFYRSNRVNLLGTDEYFA